MYYVRNEINKIGKIATILELPVEDIYEGEDTNFFICKDNTNGNYQGSSHLYSVPEHLLESQRKYIIFLEEEIKKLKEQLQNKR